MPSLHCVACDVVIMMTLALHAYQAEAQCSALAQIEQALLFLQLCCTLHALCVQLRAPDRDG